MWQGRRGLHWGGLKASVLFSLEAADGLVCAHLPDREAEEEPVPQHGRIRGHPAGHPEGRAARHHGAAKDRVRAAPNWDRSQAVRGEQERLVPGHRAGRLAPWVLGPGFYRRE